MLDRCEAEAPEAWEAFDRWARQTARRALARFADLSGAEREDVTATVVERLVSVVRDGAIHGTTDGEIAAYVRQAARRAALDALRLRGRVHDDVGDDLADPGPGASRLALARARLRAVEAALQTWTAEERYVLLAKLDGRASREIQAELARLFDVRLDARTVDTRYHRLRERLREALEAGALGFEVGSS